MVRSLLRQPSFQDFKSLEIDCLLANDLAIEVCRRFVDRDLNRCFSRSTLHSDAADSYEMHRAQEINARIGPRFSAEASDLCIDLHNTTSNFGCGIIITDTSSPDLHWKLQLCDYLRCRVPNVHILLDCLGDCSEEPYLPLTAKNDLTFEVGPQAHGTLVSEVFWNQRRLVFGALDFWSDSTASSSLTRREVKRLWRSLFRPVQCTIQRGQMVVSVHRLLPSYKEKTSKHFI